MGDQNANATVTAAVTKYDKVTVAQASLGAALDQNANATVNLGSGRAQQFLARAAAASGVALDGTNSTGENHSVDASFGAAPHLESAGMTMWGENCWPYCGRRTGKCSWC